LMPAADASIARGNFCFYKAPKARAGSKIASVWIEPATIGFQSNLSPTKPWSRAVFLFARACTNAALSTRALAAGGGSVAKNDRVCTRRSKIAHRGGGPTYLLLQRNQNAGRAEYSISWVRTHDQWIPNPACYQLRHRRVRFFICTFLHRRRPWHACAPAAGGGSVTKNDGVCKIRPKIARGGSAI